MKRILISAGSIFVGTLAICGPALAEVLVEEPSSAPDVTPQLIHWAITILGMAVAARLALQAFGRAVPVANVPTFPIYMTSRQQYQLGGWTFAAFACAFFLLLVHEHRQVLELVKPLHIVPANIVDAINDQSSSYLLIVTPPWAPHICTASHTRSPGMPCCSCAT
jgi:hypothetical protein